VYIYMKPRGQAALDLALYLLFFIPGILGLIYAGYDYAALSWRISEHSTVTAEGPPVYHFKSVIPLAGALVMLQGLAEIVRCVECLRTGAWPSRLEDVEEIELPRIPAEDDVIETKYGTCLVLRAEPSPPNEQYDGRIAWIARSARAPCPTSRREVPRIIFTSPVENGGKL
jgi:hypothetical protein